MKTNKKEFKIGDEVNIEATSGMCTGGYSTVTDIKTKFDSDTGKSYEVVCFGDHEFNMETGNPITPPWCYKIDV